jgi:hypothetical protein
MNREEILAKISIALVYETNSEKIKYVFDLEKDSEEFD